jgi:hypothetical protein
MKSLFSKRIIYNDDIINFICDTHNLVITDCLKDDNEITISDADDGDPIWVFSLVKGDYLSFDNLYKLDWQDDNYLNTINL